MITIEERIDKKYGAEPYAMPSCHENDREETFHLFGLREGYQDGAEEQQAIDIEKACKWLSENVGQYTGDEDFDPRELVEQFKQFMKQ